MANDIQKFFGGHKSDNRAKMTEALAGFSAAKHALVGKALLKLTKAGVWVFGADNEAIDTSRPLIANPASIASGFVAWYEGKIEGERMQPVSQGPIDASLLPQVNSGSVPPGKKAPSGRGWEPQSSIDLITDDETPLQLIYKTSSRGGMMGLLNLAGEIAFGLDENPERAFPLVELGTDHYIHKEYGKVYTPVLSIVGWLDSEGKPIVDKPKLNRPGLI